MKEKRHFLKSAEGRSMMPRAKKWASRTLASTFAIAVLLGVFMPLVALVGKADALRGETFAWVNKETIRMSGGALAAPIDLTLVDPIGSISNGITNASNDYKNAALTSGCIFQAKLTNIDANRLGSADFYSSSTGTGSGDPKGCYNADPAFRADYSYRAGGSDQNKQTISIANTENATKDPAPPAQMSYSGGERFAWVNETTIEMSGGGVTAVATISGTSVGSGWKVSLHGEATLSGGCKIKVNIFNVDGQNLAKGQIYTESGSAPDCFATNPALKEKYAFFDQAAHPEGPAQIAPTIDIANPENATKKNPGEMPPLPEGEDIPLFQVVHVKLATGWFSIYQGNDPTGPTPAPGEEGYRTVPKADVFSICSLAPYVNANPGVSGTFDVARAEADCIAQKPEALTYRKRVPWNVNSETGRKEIIYEGDILGVKKGYYVVCSIVTHGCSLNSPETKLPGKILVVDKWKNQPDPFAIVPDEVGSETAPPRTACELSFNPTGKRAPSWIACPFTESINFAVRNFDDLINSNLQPDLTIFDKSGNGSSYHSAWNSFRVIALGFVVIAALIMVITQAAGLDILDAYTVRKVLPRLLAAAVFITISWDVLEIFYRLSDAATIGLRSLIYAPFSNLDAIQLGGGSAFSALLLGGGALIALGWMALLSFGLSALIAVALAFFILVLIKVALAGILIASPIFIAASILPGTQKLYEFGKGALISLLLAPVVVGALIALFRVGAVIAYNRQDGNAAINQIIAILLYFGAYAAMLKGLSAVGGFAATITGFVNDRGKGLSDGLKKYRSNTRKQRTQKMASGSLYTGNNPLAKSFNWASRRTAQIPQAGLGILPGSRRKHKGLDDLRTRAAGDRAMKSEMMQQLQYDDDASAALFLSGGKSARRARSELRRLNPTWSDERINNAVSTAQAVGINRENAVAAGTLMARNKARSMGSGQALIDAVANTADYIGGRGSTTAKNIREGIQYHLRTNGRTDGAADNLDAAWGRSSMGELNNSAPAAMQAHLAHITGQLGSVDAEQRRQAAVKLIEAHTILSQGTNADSQNLINMQLHALGYDHAARSEPIENFAARLAGIGGVGAGKALRTQARAWDPQQHPGFRPVPTGTGGGTGGGGTGGGTGTS